MSEYLNAGELASLQIRGLPGTAKNIIEKAKRESWPCRRRLGKGGGFEYQVDALPQEIQDAIPPTPHRADGKRRPAHRNVEPYGAGYAV